jgi:hypothetical protein
MIRKAILALAAAAVVGAAALVSSVAGSNFNDGSSKPSYLKAKISTDCVADCVFLAW